MNNFIAVVDDFKITMTMRHDSLAIKWSFFQESIHSTLQGEGRYNVFSDLTLVSEDYAEYKVNQFVLSACSPVFKEILLENPHPHPLIYLNGVTKNELHNFLHLLYFGNATIYSSHVNGLLKFIEEFTN